MKLTQKLSASNLMKISDKLTVTNDAKLQCQNYPVMASIDFKIQA